MPHDIHDLSLAERGQQRIAWAARHMPVLGQITEEFAAEQSFEGRRIAASLHITHEWYTQQEGRSHESVQ